MDRRKISVPKREFKIRGRGSFNLGPRDEIKREKVVDTNADTLVLAPTPVVKLPVAPSKAPVTPQVSKVSPLKQKPAEVERKVAPITSSLNTSRGVYMDTVKKPTLSSNTRVNIVPPKVDEMKLETVKNKFEESLGEISKVQPVGGEKVDSMAKVEGAPNKQPTKTKKKKKFLFW